MLVVYLDVVMLLNFAVDWLLLMGTNRLCGYPLSPVRTCLGGLFGGIYAGVCLLPGFIFLSTVFWRAVALILICLVGFGFRAGSWRRGIIFLLLSMALGGIATSLGKQNIWTLIVAAGVVCLLCILGFQGKIDIKPCVPVELTYAGKHLKITALQDTGNSLCDPLSGCPVLVVDGDTALKLTGLSAAQLQQPVENISVLPGLRLIPYRAVGTEGGLLLGLRLQDVKIGSWKGSRVVAFAPGKLSTGGEYQALTGGAA